MESGVRETLAPLSEQFEDTLSAVHSSRSKKRGGGEGNFQRKSSEMFIDLVYERLMSSGERCLKKKEIDDVELEVVKPRKAITLARPGGGGAKESTGLLGGGDDLLKTNLESEFYRKMTAF